MSTRAPALTRPRVLIGIFVALLALVAVMLPVSRSYGSPGSGPKPSIVLIHGAFADASGWADVTKKLQHKGYTVYAPANPLRGLTADADYIRTYLSTIPGPLVLVGHSYGGAVITNAATGNPNVKALVYIAAFALDEGETVGFANTLGGGTTDLGSHIVVRPFPGSGAQDGDAYIDPAYFRALFAADLPAQQAAFMAAAQRPAALATLGTPSGVPAWKTIPSWYLVARDDKTIPPAAERFMAKRAGAHTVEVRSSHVAMISQPDKVSDLVLDAATSR
jgi:pimeloyl-ACP methyl ester carboxylesterase